MKIMNCKDMKAIIKNVEHCDSDNKFVVAKAFGGDNMLWYYGRYATPEKAFIVAQEITCDGCVGIVVIDDGTFEKMADVKSFVEITTECIADHEGDDISIVAAKMTGFEMIKKIIDGNYDRKADDDK